MPALAAPCRCSQVRVRTCEASGHFSSTAYSMLAAPSSRRSNCWKRQVQLPSQQRLRSIKVRTMPSPARTSRAFPMSATSLSDTAWTMRANIAGCLTSAGCANRYSPWPACAGHGESSGSDRMHTLNTIEALARARLVRSEQAGALEAVAKRYAIAITPALARLIDRDDPADPIARQFVPSPRELDATPDERADPIGDMAHAPVPGIVHPHRDRVLLKAVSACPVYCRFCFRRESVGPTNSDALTPEEIEAALSYIADHPEIWEVILT